MKWLLILLAFARSLLGAEYHPSLPAIGSLDGLGVNIHFTDAQPGELEMIKAAGFKWVRMDLTWAATERERGTHDFGAYDRLVDGLEKNGLRAVFILDYGNKLYDDGLAPHTDESRAAFAKWAAAAVARYAGKGFLWELWNEPNIAQFWKPKPDVQQYIALAKVVCPAIRAAAPREALIGPATSKIDLPFLEECFKAGLLEHWCAVSVHPYRQTTPETVEEEYRIVRLFIRKYAPKNKTIPVLSGEWGYSTAWKDYDEEKQAKYLARMFLTNIANDVPLSIWYDWRDDGDDLKEAEHRFGIVRRKYREGEKEVFEPKPAYRAAKTLTGQLAGRRFNKRLGMGREEYYHLLFGIGDDLRSVVWKKTVRSEPMAPWIEARPGIFATVDYLGQPEANLSPRKEIPKIVDLPLATAPLYLVPTAPDDVLRLGAAWSRVPLEVLVEPGQTGGFENTIRNPLDRAIQILGREAKLQPGETWTLNQPLGQSRAEKVTCHHSFMVPTLCHLWQTTYLISTMPLRVTALPITGGVLPVRIENPSGEQFGGELKLESGDPADRSNVEPIAPSAKKVKVQLTPGQTEKVLTIRLDKVPERMYYGGLHLSEKRRGFWKQLQSFGEEESLVWASVDAQRVLNLAAITASSLDQKLSVQDDGDAHIASKRIALTKAPDGLPGAGETALKLGYHTVGAGWKFFRITPQPSAPIPIRGGPEKFGLWIHGDGKGCATRIRFVDTTGQTFQPDGPRINWSGWRYVTFPMKSNEDAPLHHWGGANDGVIHYPIKWDTIFLLDNVSREPVEGEIYLSAPTLIY